MRPVGWILERPWASILALLVVIMTISITLTSLYIMPQQEQNRRDYISDCKSQGGKYVELRHRQYCIVNGVRI